MHNVGGEGSLSIYAEELCVYQFGDGGTSQTSGHSRLYRYPIGSYGGSKEQSRSGRESVACTHGRPPTHRTGEYRAFILVDEISTAEGPSFGGYDGT